MGLNWARDVLVTIVCLYQYSKAFKPVCLCAQCCWSPVIPLSSLKNPVNHMTVSHDMLGTGHRAKHLSSSLLSLFSFCLLPTMLFVSLCWLLLDKLQASAGKWPIMRFGPTWSIFFSRLTQFSALRSHWHSTWGHPVCDWHFSWM